MKTWTNDAAFIASLVDRDVAIATVFGEARGEPIEGKVAVACVLRNRLVTGRWGKDCRVVCLASKQFSCWNADGSANYEAVLQAAHALQDGHATPVLRECAWAFDGVRDGVLFDRSSGATHYATNAIIAAGKVAWAKGLMPCAVIGNHSFFRDVK